MPSEMYNPAHPGLVLRDYLEGQTSRKLPGTSEYRA
jgi:hypothetical protein